MVSNYRNLFVPKEGTLSRRHGQVVRQKIANLRSPVQIRVSPIVFTIVASFLNGKRFVAVLENN